MARVILVMVFAILTDLAIPVEFMVKEELDMPVCDPVITLQMPGCVLKEVQFSGDIDDFLSPLIAAGANQNFYELLGDVPPAVEFCPLETAYSDLRTGEQVLQTRIVAVR